jgi:hypothetical protein
MQKATVQLQVLKYPKGQQLISSKGAAAVEEARTPSNKIFLLQRFA